MKLRNASLGLVLGLAVTGATQAATLYPAGFTSSANLSLSDLLSDGWSVLRDEAYSSGVGPIDLAADKVAAGSNHILVGAYDSRTGKFVLGATGLAEVLTETSSGTEATAYGSSSLYWYNNPAASFGFTPTKDIYLNSADVQGTGFFGGSADDGNNALRLSWHTDFGGAGSGGWRAGELLFLNGDNQYHKVILVDSGIQGVPEVGSSLLLVSAGLAGLFGLRRKQD